MDNSNLQRPHIFTYKGAGGGIRTHDKMEMPPEIPIFSKFFRFPDIPIKLYAAFKDKCFREKDSFLIDRISFRFRLL
jgi:hypothetical protein